MTDPWTDEDEAHALLARAGENRPCPHCEQHKLVAELAVALGSAWERIRIARDAAAHRFEEALDRMPGPFKTWLNRAVARAKDDPNMQEGVRIVSEMGKHGE